ncbi:MAG: GyrI-like domain-containing protein [Bacteroidota bacterium]
MQLTMSLANNRIAELWRTFMPRRGEVAQRINGNVVSLQVYPPDYFAAFNPATPFEKWALVEVARVEALPAGMKPFVLPAGAYAVFHYQGPGGDPAVYQYYIFGTWFPASGHTLDHRPHFEILGGPYKYNDPASEERDMDTPSRMNI